MSEPIQAYGKFENKGNCYAVSYVADKPLETPEHYKMSITPIEFIQANNLGFEAGNVVKYICRYKHKDGLKDLLKAKRYIDFIIQHEYPNENENYGQGKFEG